MVWIRQEEKKFFLDSDDMITLTALEELYELAEIDTLQSIFFDSKVIYESEELAVRHASYLTERKGIYPDAVFSGPELFDLFINQNEWTCYVQRQFWNLEFLRRNDIRFPDGVEHEDELFTHEGLLLADRVRFIKKNYFIRRYRKGSVMTVPPTAKNFHGYFMTLCKMAEFSHKHGIQSHAADMNMSRIVENIEAIYDMLKSVEDLSVWFRENELPIYHMFDAIQKGRELSISLRPGLAETLSHFRYIYVYGAGFRANKAIYCLTANGFLVDGVVVTRREGNPDILQGHQVTPVAELKADKNDSVILLAMAPKYNDFSLFWKQMDGNACVTQIKK